MKPGEWNTGRENDHDDDDLNYHDEDEDDDYCHCHRHCGCDRDKSIQADEASAYEAWSGILERVMIMMPGIMMMIMIATTMITVMEMIKDWTGRQACSKGLRMQG